MKEIGSKTGKELEKWYLSSSEYSSNYAYLLLTSHGYVLASDKTNSYRVRPVLAL